MILAVLDFHHRGPSENKTHCIASSVGFSTAVDNHLIDFADVNKCPEYKKNVMLIVDEMYIKEDVVYKNQLDHLLVSRISGTLIPTFTSFKLL